jgi:hypothetical protein
MLINTTDSTSLEYDSYLYLRGNGQEVPQNGRPYWENLFSAGSREPFSIIAYEMHKGWCTGAESIEWS